jgi:hypothetical protein
VVYPEEGPAKKVLQGLLSPRGGKASGKGGLAHHGQDLGVQQGRGEEALPFHQGGHLPAQGGAKQVLGGGGSV